MELWDLIIEFFATLDEYVVAAFTAWVALLASIGIG